MNTTNIHAAQTNLSRLVGQAVQVETFVIAKALPPLRLALSGTDTRKLAKATRFSSAYDLREIGFETGDYVGRPCERKFRDQPIDKLGKFRGVVRACSSPQRAHDGLDKISRVHADHIVERHLIDQTGLALKVYVLQVKQDKMKRKCELHELESREFRFSPEHPDQQIDNRRLGQPFDGVGRSSCNPLIDQCALIFSAWRTWRDK